jgi:hypothetical protein
MVVASFGFRSVSGYAKKIKFKLKFKSRPDQSGRLFLLINALEYEV